MCINNKILKNVFLAGLTFSFVAVILMPSSASAQSGIPSATGVLPVKAIPGCSTMKTTGLPGVVACAVSLFNDAIYLMMGAAVVFTVWGAFQMIYSEEKRGEGRQRIYHGIIGLFVMISIWGFVNILDKTFNLSSDPISPTRLTPP